MKIINKSLPLLTINKYLPLLIINKSLPLILSLLFIWNVNVLNAENISDPLAPIKGPSMQNFGAFIGFGQNVQQGTYYSNCPCEYLDGTGIGFTIGALWDIEFISSLWGGMALSYDYRGIESSYQEIQGLDVLNKNTGISETVPILTRHTADMNVSLLTGMPYLRYQPVNWFFIRFGLSLSLVVSSSFTDTETLEQRTARLSTGEIVSITLANGDVSSVVESGSLNEMSSFVMGLEPAVGVNIPLSPKLKLSPVFQYSIPLGQLSASGENFNISAWRIFFELRYNFNRQLDD